ncbi:hypothetical protein [Segniliparus rugosus]|uniref:Helix-turn-helix domain-containing protein n=1 Tax=Segniliparus rugosus (strain ATCC BAA-974 / DSM 45345 / CCUG 50838 / CIP 108380 / JCM 13579 / CDC 945) TaxID=679197 RepID=E5XT28_SEGRC|nr:hypothetical protein [Segniliparus rugosus]EFV12499.1 hypothetical protein HMPREF9336_02650 [Segniliparus rugosus ATCC BAA-974]
MAVRWTIERIRELGPVTKPQVAFDVLGISEATGYAALRDGSFPVRVLRIGKRWVIPTSGLLKALELDQESDAA